MKNSNLLKHNFLPVIFSLMILAICYPGFMSYDSIRMLEEARSQVQGGIYPPGPVYILRIFDTFGHGPTVMIFIQNYLLLFSLNAILLAMGASVLKATILFASFVAMPTVIGAMLVLWKDVTLASLLAAALAIIYLDCKTPSDRRIKGGIVISLVFIVFSATIRFNAITATAVLTVFWINVYLARKSLFAKLAAFVGVAFVTVLVAGVVNNYRFPAMERLQPNNLSYAIMSYDLVGISKWSGVSLVPIDTAASGKSEKANFKNIEEIYSSLGAVDIQNRNSSLGNLVKLYPAGYSNSDIYNAWIAAIGKAPLAYISYRWDIFSEIIGAKNYETFEPTHFGKIDSNIFSIISRESLLTDAALRYIKYVSSIVLGKPWLFFLIVLISSLSLVRKDISDKNKALSAYSFVAAVAYILPFFILSGTGEVRYTFPSIMLGMISLFILFAKNGNNEKDYS